jgi:hypothetical protein
MGRVDREQPRCLLVVDHRVGAPVDQAQENRTCPVSSVAAPAPVQLSVTLGSPVMLRGEGPVEGRWVDRVVGLDSVRGEVRRLTFRYHERR